jgi:hypothetical protein
MHAMLNGCLLLPQQPFMMELTVNVCLSLSSVKKKDNGSQL